MMRSIIIILLLTFSSINILSQTKIIGNVVYLNSKKQPAIGVEITAFGSSGDTSKDDGNYVLNFPNTRAGTTVYPTIGDEIVINGKTIKKIELVNTEKLKTVNIPSDPNKAPLKIIVCPKGYRTNAAQAYYKIIKSSSENEKVKLKKQIADLKQKFGASNNLLQKKQLEFDRIQKIANDSLKLYKEALAYASINRDDAADRVLLFLDALDAGMDIEEARKELSTEKAFNEALEHEKGIEASLEEIEQDAKSLINLYKFDQAIQKYDTINIILRRKMYNKILLVENLYKIGMLTQKLNYFKKAEKYYQEGIEILDKRTDYISYKAHFLNNLALLQKTNNQFPKALKNHGEALKIRRVLAKENPDAHLPDVASSLNNLANIQKSINQFPLATKYYKEALQINTLLAKEKPSIYLPDVAMTLVNFGALQQDQHEFELAYPKFIKALGIYRDFAKKNPRIYLPSVAGSLDNLSSLQKAKNEIDEALKSAKEALLIRKELAKNNPRVYLSHVATSLYNYANLLLVKNDFLLASINYEESLQIYRTLAIENPNAYLPNVATTLNSIALTQKVQKNYSESLKNYKEAIQIRREFAKDNPKAYLPDLATSLNDLALLQKGQNDFEQALQNFEEVISVRRKLAIENPKTYLPDVATSLDNLALLQQAKREFSTALKNFKEALQIRKELAKEKPQIFLPSVASSLNYIAVLKQNENKLSQAAKYFDDALQIYRPLAKEKPFSYNVNAAAVCITYCTVKYLQIEKEYNPATKKEALALLQEAKEAIMIYNDSHIAKKKFTKFIDDLELYFLSLDK